MLEADLGGAGDVAGGVVRDRDAADVAALAVADGLERDVVAETVADDGGGGPGREIGAHAGPSVVGVAMGHEGAIDRAPGVDEEAAGVAVDAAIGECQ